MKIVLILLTVTTFTFAEAKDVSKFQGQKTTYFGKQPVNIKPYMKKNGVMVNAHRKIKPQSPMIKRR